MTSHHLDVVELALKTNKIEEALPLIEQTIVSYPGMMGSLTAQVIPADLSLPPSEYITIQSGLTKKLSPRMILLYDLLCAMCFMSKRTWNKAFDALERVLAYPTKDGGCSKIMVEAHNKWVLVGLLMEGSTPQLPMTVGQAAQKTYATLGKPYYAIARAFEEKTANNLKTEVESPGQHFWEEDGNSGLVREVIAHYQKWQILGLRDIYSKISLEEIRASTQNGETAAPLATVDEIEALLKSMIEEGMLDGAVVKPTDGKPAHLAFNDQAERPETVFSAELLATTQRIKNLEPLIKAANERLDTHKDYIKYLVKEQKREEAQEETREKSSQIMDQIEDEDLMMGVTAT
jgi:COP9 signalosome complex subunit 3